VLDMWRRPAARPPAHPHPWRSRDPRRLRERPRNPAGDAHRGRAADHLPRVITSSPQPALDPGDVWSIPTAGFPEVHFGQAARDRTAVHPVRLQARGVVLDPFCGSGQIAVRGPDTYLSINTARAAGRGTTSVNHPPAPAIGAGRKGFATCEDPLPFEAVRATSAEVSHAERWNDLHRHPLHGRSCARTPGTSASTCPPGHREGQATAQRSGCAPPRGRGP
jgi:hypothetical protein